MKTIFKTFILAFLLTGTFFLVAFSGLRVKAATALSSAAPRFLVISDVHLCDDSVQYVVYSKKGDSGSDLWKAAKDKMTEIIKGPNSPQFIVLLGDLTYHTTDRERAKHNVGVVLRDIRVVADAAHIPVIYAPGNNDSPYKNYGGFSFDSARAYSGCNTCWPLLGKSSDELQTNKAEMVQGSDKKDLGFYSCYPLGKERKFRVVVLNTVIFTEKYTSSSGPEADASAQMSWLKEQLKDADHENEHVLLAMHVPPGKDYAGADFWSTGLKFEGKTVQNAFLDLVAEHQKIITGLITSHTHYDGVRKLYGDSKSPKFTAVELSIPGIAPGHGNYPAMNTVEYKPDNFELEDFETFYHPYEHKEEIEKKEIIKRWGNDNFDFNVVFGNKDGLPIRQFIENLGQDKLEAGEQALYQLANEKKHKTDTDKAMDVTYQP